MAVGLRDGFIGSVVFCVVVGIGAECYTEFRTKGRYFAVSMAAQASLGTVAILGWGAAIGASLGAFKISVDVAEENKPQVRNLGIAILGGAAGYLASSAITRILPTPSVCPYG
jgi:hypothetical protein